MKTCMRRSRCSIRYPQRDARRRSEYRGFGLSASQCGLTMCGEWPYRSEDEKLDICPNAQEQAIMQEQEPKAGDSRHSSTSASHRDR